MTTQLTITADQVEAAAAFFRSMVAGLESVPSTSDGIVSLDGAAALAEKIIGLIAPDPIESMAADLAVQMIVLAIKNPGPAGENVGVQSLGKIGSR